MSDYERDYNRPPPPPRPPDRRLITGLLIANGTLIEGLALFVDNEPYIKFGLMAVGVIVYAVAAKVHYS
ncbi:MAG: hypothetical protein UX91_C0006G0097 [Candidatus Amesbacteria bacterium GW2011_GWB1_47_19]|nr:MAG: hypothetical protein UW51_C0002G0098 [Candidatus Amesbacteria bacterium GW2011_GWA1_44_24]KKU31312.1 MAG: hypothetical protein UX46_C0006G0104 [Candidatus Amesbacteria bacterium GW2011_GWC1_46_24]KKU67035.1 MAG: hypothetical protein UX91_C0006G0097 [Candidatus Amesbacteria bacterium GW2011_GWB1_47_19]OGD04973.1 MAG: hypothetical protein A2379_04330 [Candidatus Amesbacteria bacterium RIFOXYB1_FULL_47_13]HBC72747.1 hypothetical protein [Candidatus Amesbacteria bacterium]